MTGRQGCLKSLDEDPADVLSSCKAMERTVFNDGLTSYCSLSIREKLSATLDFALQALLLLQAEILRTAE